MPAQTYPRSATSFFHIYIFTKALCRLIYLTKFVVSKAQTKVSTPMF